MSKRSDDSDGALLLAPEPPFPLAGGGAIRTASLARFLAAHFRLHLVTFAVGEAPVAPVEIAERIDWIHLPAHGKTPTERMARNAGRLWRGVPPLTDRFCEPASRAQVAQALSGNHYRVAVVEHFWCAPYLDLVRQHADYTVLDLHNIESVLHAQCAASEPGPASWAHRRFATIARRAEQELLPRFDLVLTASENDRRLALELAPEAEVAVYPNAIPSRCLPAVAEEHCIAFSGNLEYHPNVTAVRYFAREIWPELRRQDPQLRWRLIGKNENAVRRWIQRDPHIETTGPVQDALAELARAKVIVVPLLAGSGTRLKILEAWAAGRAVVSTSLGAAGLPAEDGVNLLLADTPAAMCDAVLRLLADVGLRQRLGEAGRTLVERKFCWPAVWPGLEQTLAAALPADRQASQGVRQLR
jgi:glycosyltransferase involved in cell wall biosynthesis